jgi:rhodanese-related sulfurtransferase
MAPANAAGPAVPDLSTPERADSEQIRKRLAGGEWVVDLRNRVAFASGHVAGTLNFGLDGNFATYLGWLIPWGTPLTLLGETPGQVAQAQRELVRIGIDRPAAYATGTPSDWAEPGDLSTVLRAAFADLVQVRHHRQVVVLDVRRDMEWAQSHLDGAVHIPLHELPRRLDEVPDGEVWVHCAAGYRASIAASMLAAAGRRVVAVDDDFDRARAAGHLRRVLAIVGPS